MTICNGPNGYLYVYDPATQHTYYLHRYVWTQYHGDIPPGYHVHHIDGNRKNNDISNLELIDGKTHNQLEMHRIRRDKLAEKNRLKNMKETTEKNKNKKIYVAENGKTYNTVSDAINDLNLPHNAKQNINHVLNGTRQKTAYGYTWRYISA